MDGFDVCFADKFLAPDAADRIFGPFETHIAGVFAFVVERTVFGIEVRALDEHILN
jgi:hypothetical protein